MKIGKPDLYDPDIKKSWHIGNRIWFLWFDSCTWQAMKFGDSLVFELGRLQIELYFG